MKIIKRILFILVVAVAIIAYFNYPKLNLISGFASKNMASSVFIADRSPEAVRDTDNDIPLVKLAEVSVSENSATGSVYGLMKRTSVYREGLGCVLVNEDFDSTKPYLKPNRNIFKNNLAFPYGDTMPKDTVYENVNYPKLNAAIANSFSDPEIKKTRTVLVYHKNRIIAEKYLNGFDKNTPILGWSTTKSIMATLYGILEYQGRIDLNSPAPVVAWQNDERKNITLNHLLRMQSGLAWEEDYTKISDVTKMLFLATDMTTAQAEKEAIAKPTEVWNYSSGTSNLLTGILRKQFKTTQEYLDFPYAQLIDKIGMHSMLLEADMAGNYVGSSYAWANTRDWAKFGILYLNKGLWNGEQLFDEKWVKYITKPTAHSKGTYGGHFWLNAEGKYPDVPRDMFSANGFQGQRIFIIPSKDLVIVRTGLSEEPEFDMNTFLSEIISAIH
ncbi:serine hydrolase [Cellulophaga sp. Hel_I_12]|uniref:serine hydrolase domain-containing protein n=1 Tax=Cellulophaga sp. Hel_I_12 TaxID=1249972 RepID=UPI00064775C4|nr:serine hydrolase [Cellulophaga sp. Hel_I_12]